MAGSAQLWPGPRMRAFFRSLFAAEAGVDDALADRLADRCVKNISRMLVWNAPAVTGPAESEPPPATASVEAPPTAPKTEKSEAESADGSFDPFAFSVVVVLKRQGRAALLKKLGDIKNAANLRKIAEAQHLGVDKSITTTGKLREAIIAGAEQRLADRRAAAS